MPSGQYEGIANAFTYIEGTANFPYQILLLSFHLQYRNVLCIKVSSVVEF